MTIFHFPQFEHEYFLGILSVYVFFLLNVVIVRVNGKYALFMRVLIVKPKLFEYIGVFMFKVSKRHGICLSTLLGILLNFRMLVVLLDILSPILIHSMIDLIMLLFIMTFVLLFTITLLYVLLCMLCSTWFILSSVHRVWGVCNLVETPLEGCCDLFEHEGSSSFSCDNVLLNPFGHSHVSPRCSQPSFSPKY